MSPYFSVVSAVFRLESKVGGCYKLDGRLFGHGVEWVMRAVEGAEFRLLGRKLNPLWADRVGICLSTLCLIHCLLTPVIFLLLPALNFGFFHHQVHVVLFFVLPLVALVAFVPGYRRHRNLQVFAWALPGFALILAGILDLQPIFGEEYTEMVLSVAGSLFLIRAHLLNRRLCACCAGHRSAGASRL